MRLSQWIGTWWPVAGLITLLLAAPAFGSTIVSITGSGSFIESGDAGEWGAQAWTQTGSYTGVTIRATFGYGYWQGAGSAFLEKKVGNHAVEVAAVAFVFPKNPTEIKLFSGLALGPGTFYLASFGEGDWISDPIEANPVITSATDVSNVTDTLISTDSGHTFYDSNNQIFEEFRITGQEVPVNETPEPSASLVLLGAAIVMAAVARRRPR